MNEITEREALLQLVGQFVALVKFHELQHEDDHAQKLLNQAEEVLGFLSIDSQEFKEWVESVRIANICALSP